MSRTAHDDAIDQLLDLKPKKAPLVPAAQACPCCNGKMLEAERVTYGSCEECYNRPVERQPGIQEFASKRVRKVCA